MLPKPRARDWLMVFKDYFNFVCQFLGAWVMKRWLDWESIIGIKLLCIVYETRIQSSSLERVIKSILQVWFITYLIRGVSCPRNLGRSKHVN